jgi:TM2 domain-containing membrane protein YozV
MDPRAPESVRPAAAAKADRPQARIIFVSLFIPGAGHLLLGAIGTGALALIAYAASAVPWVTGEIPMLLGFLATAAVWALIQVHLWRQLGVDVRNVFKLLGL